MVEEERRGQGELREGLREVMCVCVCREREREKG
jgi:hypothetical protein